MEGPLERAAMRWITWTGMGFAVAAGLCAAAWVLIDPESPVLASIALAGAMIVAGLLVAALFLALLTRVRTTAHVAATPTPTGRPEPASTTPGEAAGTPPAKSAASPAPALAKPDAADELRKMKTYIELEAWDLAYEKAQRILREFSGTPEAEAVMRNINELRWKAEPKFLPDAPEGRIGEAAMEAAESEPSLLMRHLTTFVDLEMWDLALEKAEALVRKYPDSDEAVQAFRLLEKMRAARAAPGGSGPAPGPSMSGGEAPEPPGGGA